MKQLKKEYCNNTATKTNQITEDILETAVKKIHPNKAPGQDLIAGFWYENFDFYKPALTCLKKHLKVKENCLYGSPQHLQFYSQKTMTLM